MNRAKYIWANTIRCHWNCFKLDMGHQMFPEVQSNVLTIFSLKECPVESHWRGQSLANQLVSLVISAGQWNFTGYSWHHHLSWARHLLLSILGTDGELHGQLHICFFFTIEWWIRCPLWCHCQRLRDWSQRFVAITSGNNCFTLNRKKHV